MRASVALLLLTLPLAGCAAPPPSSDGDGIEIGPTPVQPPSDKSGLFHNGTQVDTRNDASAGNSTALPDANSTSPTANGTLPNGTTDTTRPPANTTNTTGPAANATQTPPPITHGNGTGEAAGNGTGNGTGGSPPPDPGNATPPVPTPNAQLPTWHIGDSHIYYGEQKDRDGNVKSAYYDWRNVTANDTSVAGVPVYVVNATTTTVDGSSSSSTLQNMTKDGLNHVNSTGWVTELYRFPLWEGKNWTYGYESTYQSEAGPFTSTYVGDVGVVGQELLFLERCGCQLATWKLHADITTSFGAFHRENHVDYWFSPEARDTVKVHTVKDDGSVTDEELTYADLR